MTFTAITGGIGSGKSFICRLLQDRYGIRVYDCDAAARRLMASSEALQKALNELVGEEVFRDHVLQKPVLSRYILASDAHKQAVNDIVHPAVAADFLSSGYTWLESAILFESGFYKRVRFDTTVCVTAPLEVRVARVMARDGMSRERALEWINSQMSQEEIICRCDIAILNDGVQPLDKQIETVVDDVRAFDAYTTFK